MLTIEELVKNALAIILWEFAVKNMPEEMLEPHK